MFVVSSIMGQKSRRGTGGCRFWMGGCIFSDKGYYWCHYIFSKCLVSAPNFVFLDENFSMRWKFVNSFSTANNLVLGSIATSPATTLPWRHCCSSVHPSLYLIQLFGSKVASGRICVNVLKGWSDDVPVFCS